MRIIGVFIIALSIASCEKIIDVKINDSEPQLVIDGIINTDTTNYKVRVSKTVAYNSSSDVFVDNAVVSISDDLGNTELLSYVGEGLYESAITNADTGRLYTVNVNYEGINYENYSRLKKSVPLDSINLYYAQENQFPGIDEGYYLRVYFTDPVGYGDRYRLVFIKNDTIYNGPDDYHLFDDNFDDGLQDIAIFFDYKLLPGEKVKVEFWTLDEHVHEYYRTLQNIISEGFAPTGVPDNPNSTWTNGALGVFNAYSYDSDSLMVP